MTVSGTRSIFIAVAAAFFASGCAAKKISETCDDPQAYQAVVPSKRIEVPDGLDPLDDFREMPVPESTGPERQKGGPCIESPPSVLTKSE